MATRLEALAEKIHEQLNDQTVKSAFGRKEVARNDQRRRVVWVPVGGPLTPPEKRSAGTVVPNGTGQARRHDVVLRQERVQVHVTAESDESLEQLFENLLAAIGLTIPRPTWHEYRWVTEEEGQAGDSLRVPKIRFEITIQLPVAEEIKPLTVVTGEDHTCGFLTAEGEFES